MKIDKKSIKLWSKMGSRAVFGLSLIEIQKEIENLLVVTADVSTSAGLDRFKKICRDKYIDVGIAEQNMIGVATGLSNLGYKVLTTTFSPFQTLRCCEQIKNNLGYMNSDIVMVGLASGLVLGTLGFTHASIEDVGAIRSIPNINIISPSDCLETVKSIYASLKNNNPTYIRLTGGQINQIVYEDDYDFQIGKASKLRDGDEMAIVACGTRVRDAMDAADHYFENFKKKISVYNFHTIKPIDRETLITISKKYKYVLSYEEHNVIGGLGSSVSEIIASLDTSIRHFAYGVPDLYPKGGDYAYLLKTLKIDKNGIYEQILKLKKN